MDILVHNGSNLFFFEDAEDLLHAARDFYQDSPEVDWCGKEVIACAKDSKNTKDFITNFTKKYLDVKRNDYINLLKNSTDVYEYYNMGEELCITMSEMNPLKTMLKFVEKVIREQLFIDIKSCIPKPRDVRVRHKCLEAERSMLLEFEKVLGDEYFGYLKSKFEIGLDVCRASASVRAQNGYEKISFTGPTVSIRFGSNVQYLAFNTEELVLTK